MELPLPGGKNLRPVTKLDTSSWYRVVGIQLLTNSCPITFLSVYLPSRSGCTDDFRESLDYLDSLISNLGLVSDIIIIGDLNADPGPAGGPNSSTSSNEQGLIFIQYLKPWNFVSSHLVLSSPPFHTYESKAHGSLSTIDHILCPSFLLSSFVKSCVLEESPLNTSDHLALSSSLQVDRSSSSYPQKSPKPFSHRLNWTKLSDDAIYSLYTTPLDEALGLLAPLPDCPLEEPVRIDQLLSKIAKVMKDVFQKRSKEMFP